MKKLAILSISLLIFVFLAGCATTSSTTGSGVTIESFSALPTTAEPNTPVLLQLKVQNTGGVVSGSVSAELLGLTDEWAISQGRSQTIGELYPPDSSRGITQGEERVIEWDLSAPGKTRDIPYSATAHVSYTYTTTLEAQIKAVTSEYLRQTGESGGIEFQGVSAGPFSMKIIAPTTVISGGRIPVQVEIQNIGGGHVASEKLTLQTSGLNCSKSDVTLIGGKSASLYCTLPIGIITNYRIFPISISTSYKYWIESTTSITVLKSPIGITPTPATGCIRGYPSVSITPSSQSGVAGSTLTYSVIVTNNDNSASCTTPSTFTLTPSCPSGWICSLSQNSLTILSGSSGTATLSVTSSAATGTTPNLWVTAYNNADTNKAGTGSATYTVI